MMMHKHPFLQKAEESARRIVEDSRQMARTSRDMIEASKKLLNQLDDSKSA